MSNEPSEVDPEQAPTKLSLPRRLIAVVPWTLEWARHSRVGMIVVGALGLCMLTGILVLWSLLARLAVVPAIEYNLQMALDAIDEKRFEDARAVIGALQYEESDQQTIGGSLFVLGIVKADEANSEYSADRRGAMHLVAARYLQKARMLGVPADREAQLLFQLGESLVEANQAKEGIEALNEALAIHGPTGPTARKVHQVLLFAHLRTADPDFATALLHADRILSDESLPDADRAAVQPMRVELLIRLERMQEARAALKDLQERLHDDLNFHLLSGRLDMLEASSVDGDPARRAELLQSAENHFQEVQSNGATAGAAARQAQFWNASLMQQRGQTARAIVKLDELRKSFGDSSVGMAAQLRKAELELSTGAFDRALTGFRHVLESIPDRDLFVNPLLSISDLRKRLLLAHQQFIDANHYEQALNLVEQFEPVFSHIERVAQRARTHEQWGRFLAKDALQQDDWEATQALSESRRHLRAAGRAYEDLARLRVASRAFPDDLMKAATSYFDGQSYSHSIRVLQEYLEHEAQRLNAYALLLLGEAQLAQNKPDGAIASLRECIEMYPSDGSVYQARLVRARAHQQKGEYQLAEQLLRANLYEDDLTPDSIQWRDSLFTLGHLLYDAQKYETAVQKLAEAVQRYPDAEEFLLAKYTVARAHQRAAEVYAERLRAAKTPNEQQKNRDEMMQELENAHSTFEEVQRALALKGLGDGNLLHHTLLRNCYMMRGSVLFKLKRYEEARQAFSDIVTYYQGEPYVLEAFVQVSNCWRRLNEPMKARATIQSAVLALERLPEDVDFQVTTNFSRPQWELMLDQMKQW